MAGERGEITERIIRLEEFRNIAERSLASINQKLDRTTSLLTGLDAKFGAELTSLKDRRENHSDKLAGIEKIVFALEPWQRNMSNQIQEVKELVNDVISNRSSVTPVSGIPTTNHEGSPSSKETLEQKWAKMNPIKAKIVIGAVVGGSLFILGIIGKFVYDASVEKAAKTFEERINYMNQSNQTHK